MIIFNAIGVLQIRVANVKDTLFVLSENPSEYRQKSIYVLKSAN